MDTGAIVLGVLGFAAVAVFFALARRARHERRRLDREGLLVDAEVLNVWQEVAGYRVRYRYTPEGASAAVVRSEISACLRALVPEPGDRVRVRYDPRDPVRRARLLGPDEAPDTTPDRPGAR
ncbi:MAG: hypothetical protein O2975_03630 [Proteobacteria bacterium]|nr:hypothetical protein [Pseudomonadota bacterium]